MHTYDAEHALVLMLTKVKLNCLMATKRAAAWESRSGVNGTASQPNKDYDIVCSTSEMLH